jgi:2-iminobutanoate/2-iminopropanoate deaminase
MQAPHYSPYVIHNGLVYVSGQLPVLPTEPKVPLGIEAQTLLVLEKLSQVLADAGTDKSNLLQVRIYISDIAFWDTVNEIYAKFMGAHKPARCIVPSGKLHFDCLIEIEAIACL